MVFISITLIGSAGVNNKHMLKRSAAKTGDKITVTNSLGASAAGLEMLRKGLKFPPKMSKQLRQSHLTPNPRVNEGQLLVEKGVKCGMDVSDGLVGDLAHICMESKVGAQINVDLVPISPAIDQIFNDYHGNIFADRFCYQPNCNPGGAGNGFAFIDRRRRLRTAFHCRSASNEQG